MKRRPLFFRSQFWWIAFAIWFAVLFALSSFDNPDIDGPEIPHLDKAMHLVYFAAGGFCLMLALFFATTRRIGSKLLRFTIVFVTISLIGVTDEWHQTFTEGRQGADVFDWLADTMGGLLAGIAGLFVPGPAQE